MSATCQGTVTSCLRRSTFAMELITPETLRRRPHLTYLKTRRAAAASPEVRPPLARHFGVAPPPRPSSSEQFVSGTPPASPEVSIFQVSVEHPELLVSHLFVAELLAFKGRHASCAFCGPYQNPWIMHEWSLQVARTPDCLGLFSAQRRDCLASLRPRWRTQRYKA